MEWLHDDGGAQRGRSLPRRRGRLRRGGRRDSCAGGRFPRDRIAGQPRAARAVAQGPELLLCDEPTGHLDSDTAARVLDLIEALQTEFRFALVVATHDVDVAARLDRELELEDGRVVREEGR